MKYSGQRQEELLQSNPNLAERKPCTTKHSGITEQSSFNRTQAKVSHDKCLVLCTE